MTQIYMRGSRHARLQEGRDEMIDTIITRMRRKIDIVRLDARSRQDATYHVLTELLSLLDMLERELDAELAKVESGLEALQKMQKGENLG